MINSDHRSDLIYWYGIRDGGGDGGDGVGGGALQFI